MLDKPFSTAPFSKRREAHRRPSCEGSSCQPSHDVGALCKVNILVLLIILELDIHGFRGLPQPLVIVRLLLQLVLSLVDLLGQVDATLQLIEDGEVGWEGRKVVRCIAHQALAAVSSPAPSTWQPRSHLFRAKP